MLSRDRGSAGPVPFAQAPGLLASKAPPRRLPYSSRRRPPRSYPWAFVPAVPLIALPPATGGPDGSASSCTAWPGPCVDSLETPGRGHGCPQSGQHPIWAHGAGVLRPLTPVHVGWWSQAGKGDGQHPLPTLGPGEEQMSVSRLRRAGGSAELYILGAKMGTRARGHGWWERQAAHRGHIPGPQRTGTRPDGETEALSPSWAGPMLALTPTSTSTWRGPRSSSGMEKPLPHRLGLRGRRDACGVGEPELCGTAGAGAGLCSHSRAGSQRKRREATPRAGTRPRPSPPAHCTL